MGTYIINEREKLHFDNECDILEKLQKIWGKWLGRPWCCDDWLPAAGVMTTRPVIIPWTAPMTEGLPNTNTSMSVHTSKLVAAQMLVLMTAIDESTLAAYGSPPLNPAHPSHSNPAPANINSTLFGGNRSRSFVNLGPTCQFQNSHRYTVRTD